MHKNNTQLVNDLEGEGEVIVDLISVDTAHMDAEDLTGSVESTEPTFGVVTNCMMLYIRSKPNKDAEVVCSVKALTELMIDLNNSTDEWFKVYNVEGVEGFCMKKYVAIKQ